MCGGGTFRLLDQLPRATSEAPVGHGRERPGSHASSDIVWEVQCMYARGDIDAETLHRLLRVASASRVSALVSTPTVPPNRRLNETVRAPQRIDDPALKARLQQLATERLQLQAAYDETYQAIQRLEAEAHRLHEQAEVAEMKARSSLGDDIQMHIYLEERQDALGQAAAVEERIAFIQNSLELLAAQLNDLVVREAALDA